MEQQNNNDQELKGYPHYPASEDITRATNNNGRERLDKEKPTVPFNDTVDDRDPESGIRLGTDADLTEDELQMLEYADQNMADDNLNRASLDDTDADGDHLSEAGSISSHTDGGMLDVPGSEDDDDLENIGSEDEENNYYSLGGDNHESLEEAKE